MGNRIIVLVAVVVFGVACVASCGGGEKGSDEDVDAGGVSDTGGVVDAGAVADTGGAADAGGAEDTGGAADAGGTDAGAGDAGVQDAGGHDAGTPTVTVVTGTISADETWSGIVRVTGNVTIAPGVHVTVAPGTEIRGAEYVGIIVKGTLTVGGTADAVVTLAPDVAGKVWTGFSVMSGGTLTMGFTSGTGLASVVACGAGALACDLNDVTFHDVGQALNYASTGTVVRATIDKVDDAGVTVSKGGDLTITDSRIWGSAGDIVKPSGGSITIDHSEIGSTAAYQHCVIHIGGSEHATITNNVLTGGVYAFMIGGTSGTVVNRNNIVKNTNQVLDMGGATNVDMRDNYWDKGAPSVGAAYDTSSPASAPFPDAGPR